MLLVAAANATAALIDFNSGLSNNQSVPQNYGAVPNVTIAYGDSIVGTPQADTSLSYAYGGLQGVIFSVASPSNTPLDNTPITRVRLTADPGYQVTLNSFDLGSYLAAPNNYNVDILVVDQLNTPLFHFATGVNGSILGGPTANDPHNTFSPGVTAQSLTLSIYTGNARGNLALDNISYAVAAVPEPSTVVLLAGGLALFAFVVGRRSRGSRL